MPETTPPTDAQDDEPTVTDRGFKHFDMIPSRYGGGVRVYESSLADGPHVWVSVTAPVNLNEPHGATHEAPAHLALDDANRLRDQLTYFAEHHYQQRLTAATHTDTAAEALSREAIQATREPFPMYGFEGCTHISPDHCACATDEDIECDSCGDIIEPGVLTYARTEGFPWVADDDPVQVWTTRWWHASCDTRVTAEPAAEQARAGALTEAEAALDRVRALPDEWESATCITDGAPCSFHRHARGYADDLRAALAGDAEHERSGT